MEVLSPLRRFLPFVLLCLSAIYLIVGASAFVYFEKPYHENAVRKWNLNQAVNRRQQARQISSRIFNDTKNLLIIIDRDQTERVQGLLVNALKQYEGHLDFYVPQRDEWNFLYSFNYAWSLLITLGHGRRSPQSNGGQVFSYFYSVIGVPLVFGTLAVLAYALLSPFIRLTHDKSKRKVAVMVVMAALYLVWLFLIALYLYTYTLPKSFWDSFYTATLSAFTIQTQFYNKLSETSTFVVLAGSTIAVFLALFILFILSELYNLKSETNLPTMMKDEPESASPKSDPPKFTMIVDEAGDSKLADVRKE
ncbi:hypothetical protein L596_000041 [Steinernema carpocapsae]|uniref:Potassium channel domain-containing protein n=1 Tax=Steinernema carpocapsae TaxID=34508 RepID=A0A4U8UHN3_STECR|nr:hypothetical protein L596_000041 [Steinernema carpocapsae]